jgi:hypothetical protein
MLQIAFLRHPMRIAVGTEEYIHPREKEAIDMIDSEFALAQYWTYLRQIAKIVPYNSKEKIS